MKKLFWIAPILVLAACDAPTTTTATSGSTARPGEVTGSYDPSTMGRDAVIKQIMQQCGGTYNHVWETQLDNGMTAYTARCGA